MKQTVVNCEAVHFSESKGPLKSSSEEHKRPVRNCDFKKNETEKHCREADHNFSWYQKFLIGKAG